MKKNYYTVHGIKKPKKLKYSKPYSTLQLEKMQKCTQYFINETIILEKRLLQINLKNNLIKTKNQTL